LFPTQPYINPHKALNFGIKGFFGNLENWLLRSSMVRKMKKIRLKEK
jgi:hypothetical protein